jgi:hypothetical protein
MPSTQSGQAWYVLAGFRYHLLHTLSAWLQLQNGETLWQEVDEDFSVESPIGWRLHRSKAQPPREARLYTVSEPRG